MKIRTKALFATIFAAVISLSLPATTFAKVESTGDDIVNVGGWSYMLLSNEKYKECSYNEEILDLTSLKGSRATIAEGLATDLGEGVNCLVLIQEQVVSGFLLCGENSVLKCDPESHLTSDGKYKVVGVDTEKSKQTEAAAKIFANNEEYPTEINNIVSKDSPLIWHMDDEKGIIELIIANTEGTWNLKNSAHWEVAVECMPTADDYADCGEVTYTDHYNNNKQTIAKGKILKQDLTVSRIVCIGEKYCQEAKKQSTSTTTTEETPKESSANTKLEAPNTGFESNNLAIFIAGLMLVGSATAFALRKR